MTKILSCREVGADCDYVVHGDTDEEVLEKVIQHATQAHNISHISEECIEQLKAAIREE